MATPETQDSIRIGIDAEARATIVGILNRLLADEFLLYARARAFHWNVTGRNFKQDHALFEEEYEALDEVIDEVAERARALGGLVQGMVSQYLENATQPEVDSIGLTSDAMIAAMRDGHEALIRSLRADVEVVESLGDEGTADFLIGLMESHEKRAWMLRSHLG